MQTAMLFAGIPSLAEIEKRYVLQILTQTQGNLARAAQILKVDRSTLIDMVRRYQFTQAAIGAAESRKESLR